MESIILASSSKYRKALLERIIPSFECISPEIDETPQKDESAESLTKRLSIEKAKVVSISHLNSWVIGSDQVAVYNNQLLGKPGSHKKAREQLSQFSNNSVEFLTGIALVNQAKQQVYYDCDLTIVEFKALSEKMIESYLSLDKPYDCAGSFKVESFGPVLFDKVTSHDPTALQGLPLIKLAKLFEKAGIDLLSLG